MAEVDRVDRALANGTYTLPEHARGVSVHVETPRGAGCIGGPECSCTSCLDDMVGQYAPELLAADDPDFRATGETNWLELNVEVEEATRYG